MFDFIKKSLSKTIEAITRVAPKRREQIDKEELEEILVAADIDYELVEKLLESLPQNVNRVALFNALASVFIGLETKPVMGFTDAKPLVDVIIGINGAGKTTTIAKLAKRAKNEGKSVILGAGDTFRAAATEQLTLWAEKVGVPIVSAKAGADPAAIAFDTISSALAKGIDYCIIDTAGRQQTSANLSNELKKIVKVCDKAMSGAPHRKILIIDGTAGSAAITQAMAFDEMVGLSAIIVTKMDGTAKGGAIFTIAHELKLPIIYIGVGEKDDDLAIFSTKEYINGLLDAIFIEEA